MFYISLCSLLAATTEEYLESQGATEEVPKSTAVVTDPEKTSTAAPQPTKVIPMSGTSQSQGQAPSSLHFTLLIFASREKMWHELCVTDYWWIELVRVFSRAIKPDRTSNWNLVLDVGGSKRWHRVLWIAPRRQIHESNCFMMFWFFADVKSPVPSPVPAVPDTLVVCNTTQCEGWFGKKFTREYNYIIQGARSCYGCVPPDGPEGKMVYFRFSSACAPEPRNRQRGLHEIWAVSICHTCAGIFHVFRPLLVVSLDVDLSSWSFGCSKSAANNG